MFSGESQVAETKINQLQMIRVLQEKFRRGKAKQCKVKPQLEVPEIPKRKGKKNKETNRTHHAFASYKKFSNLMSRCT